MQFPSVSTSKNAGVVLGALLMLGMAAGSGYSLVTDSSDDQVVTEQVAAYEDPAALAEMSTPDLPDNEPPTVEAAGEVDEAPAAEAQDAPAVATGSVWDRLADCESGDWVDGWPQPGTARWDYGLTFSHGDSFEGGLNFHPRTWDSFKDAGMPDHAGQASREQQIMIGERVLAAQGWGAWPVCSEMLGLR